MRISPRTFRFCVIFSVAVAAAGILTFPFWEPLWRGFLLRYTILQAIDSASSIRVIEHSGRYDIRYLPPDQHKEEVYSSRILDAREITALKKALPLSVDHSGTTYKGCRFNPHHRIEFVKRDASTFRLDLCFSCDELSVDRREKRIFPVRWNDTLRTFFTQIGINPDDGPWKVQVEPPDDFSAKDSAALSETEAR